MQQALSPIAIFLEIYRFASNKTLLFILFFLKSSDNATLACVLLNLGFYLLAFLLINTLFSIIRYSMKIYLSLRSFNMKVDMMYDRSGMTLVELMVFMSLTLFLLGGVIPVALQASQVDKDGEEKLAAFFACKSALEKLQGTDFDKLTEPGSNFHPKENKSNIYIRKRNHIPFHTRGGLFHTELKATERTELIYGSTGDSTNCSAKVTMKWKASRGAKKVANIKESAHTVLYP